MRFSSAGFQAVFAILSMVALVSTPGYAQSSAKVLPQTPPDGEVAPTPSTPLLISDNDYPLLALSETEEGSVTLNVLVDVQGRVTFTQTLISSGSVLLDQTASQVARTRWIFQPGRKAGQPAVGAVKVEVSWKLPLRPADDLSAEMLGAPITGRTITGPSLIREGFRATAADYPYASVRAREQGEVVLRIVVLEDGSAGDVRLVSSSRFPRLDERALEIAKSRFRYSAGTVDGQPTRMAFTLAMPFVLAPIRPNVSLKFCRSVPVLGELVYALSPEGEVERTELAAQPRVVPLQYHVTADGTVDDVLIPTKQGWMRFNASLIQNFSRVAAMPPAARVNRPPSCWFDGTTAVGPMQQNSTEALLQSGAVNRRLNDADRAIEDYTKAIAINPNLATAYNARAVAYSTKGEYDNALRDHDQAIRLSPNIPAHLGNRGITYLKQGRFEEAIKDFDQVIRLNPRIVFGFYNRCFALAASGKPREGIADCDRALRLTPGSAITLDARGYSYLRLGNYQAAIADYDASIKANPKAADPHFGRGVAKIKSGNAADGNADIAEAVKIDPQIASRMAAIGVTP